MKCRLSLFVDGFWFPAIFFCFCSNASVYCSLFSILDLWSSFCGIGSGISIHYRLRLLHWIICRGNKTVQGIGREALELGIQVEFTVRWANKWGDVAILYEEDCDLCHSNVCYSWCNTSSTVGIIFSYFLYLSGFHAIRCNTICFGAHVYCLVLQADHSAYGSIVQPILQRSYIVVVLRIEGN